MKITTDGTEETVDKIPKDVHGSTEQERAGRRNVTALFLRDLQRFIFCDKIKIKRDYF